MSNKLAYALMIIIAIGAVVWGLVSYNDLARNRSELNVLRIEVEALERDLAQTEEELNAVEQELSSAELSISSLEAELELYKDIWGAEVTSGVDWPSYDINLANSETASNPKWAELLDFLREDKTDENTYVPDVYVCRHFARDLHNNAELAGIRAAYVAVNLPDAAHALNAFKTTDRGLVFIDCAGLPASQPGPSNCDKTVDVRLGEHYIPESLFPESKWSSIWENMGTVLDMRIWW
jgi:hypothetical protein